MDYTTIHSSCVNQCHLIDLHLWRGAPHNLDESRPIEILVNHGHVVGFCPARLQPAWSAYRVASAEEDVDYQRPLSYYDDMRLDEPYRIGRKTFGKLGNIQLNVGHMTPNEVINRQFGRLAQLETFLMSNMSPQYGSFNSGVWLKLESAIRRVDEREPRRGHLWAIVGPVFGDEPQSIYRGRDKLLPVPESYFCVIVDPQHYPFDSPSKVALDCYLLPQTAPRDSFPDAYPATLDEVEAATNLKFFAAWGRELPVGVSASRAQWSTEDSRLVMAFNEMRAEEEAAARENAADADVDSIDGLIELLEAEAASIQVQGRALTDEERARIRTIQHTISWLVRARNVVTEDAEDEAEAPESTLITYKIVNDMDDKLEQGARTACSFWNRFVQPRQSIVIRLGTFTQIGSTIARAYEPYENDGIRYGRVEFNTRYLAGFSEEEIAGTIIHEIGHSLGIGWDAWEDLYHRETGQFNARAVHRLRALRRMEVERDGGPGTAYAHWDEKKFDKELMTGYQDQGEHVLPVTIDLMRVLGHTVIEQLPERTLLSDLLRDAASVVFTRQDEAMRLNRDHFEETEIFETIPHQALG